MATIRELGTMIRESLDKTGFTRLDLSGVFMPSGTAPAVSSAFDEGRAAIRSAENSLSGVAARSKATIVTLSDVFLAVRSADSSVRSKPNLVGDVVPASMKTPAVVLPDLMRPVGMGINPPVLPKLKAFPDTVVNFSMPKLPKLGPLPALMQNVGVNFVMPKIPVLKALPELSMPAVPNDVGGIVKQTSDSLAGAKGALGKAFEDVTLPDLTQIVPMNVQPPVLPRVKSLPDLMQSIVMNVKTPVIPRVSDLIRTVRMNFERLKSPKIKALLDVPMPESHDLKAMLGVMMPRIPKIREMISDVMPTVPNISSLLNVAMPTLPKLKALLDVAMPSMGALQLAGVPSGGGGALTGGPRPIQLNINNSRTFYIAQVDSENVDRVLNDIDDLEDMASDVFEHKMSQLLMGMVEDRPIDEAHRGN